MKIIRAKPIIVLLLALISMMALVAGCASQKGVDMQPAISKRITGISISDEDEAVAVIVKGDPLLTYEAIKQVEPAGVLFRFPETTLESAKGVYTYPSNEMITSIAADEIVHAAVPTARIRIVLKMDRPYDVKPDAAGMRIVFAKLASHGKPIQAQTEEAAHGPETKPALKSVDAATRLIGVTATPLPSKVAVHVTADGTIQDFTAFTLDQPARIVIDMHWLASSHRETQKMGVDSKWVSGVRYSGHPDKVRLVLDTHSNYLSSYSALPTDTGLLIYVGEMK